MTRYRFVAHNVGDLPRPRAVAMVEDYLDDIAPDCVVLSEAEGFRPLVDRAGYRTRIAEARPGTFIVVGIREDHRITGAAQMRMRRTWRGPKRAVQRPARHYPLVTWETDQRVRFDTFGLHLPYDGPNGVNAIAWRESAQRIEDRWVARSNLPRPRHITALGDWNGTRDQIEAHVHNAGARVLRDSLKVDHMRTSASLQLVDGRRLADVPAHPPYLWVVEDRDQEAA